MESEIFENSLSEPQQVVGLDLIEAALLVVFFGLGVYISWKFYVLMIALPVLLVKLRKKNQRGYLKHLIYATGWAKYKYYPEYHEEEFVE